MRDGFGAETKELVVFSTTEPEPVRHQVFLLDAEENVLPFGPAERQEDNSARQSEGPVVLQWCQQ